MAVVRNTTTDTLSIGRPDAPPVAAGDEATVSDARFAGTAWPKSTWALVKKPGKGYTEASTDDAHLFFPAEAVESPAGDNAEESA